MNNNIIINNTSNLILFSEIRTVCIDSQKLFFSHLDKLKIIDLTQTLQNNYEYHEIIHLKINKAKHFEIMSYIIWLIFYIGLYTTQLLYLLWWYQIHITIHTDLSFCCSISFTRVSNSSWTVVLNVYCLLSVSKVTTFIPVKSEWNRDQNTIICS